MLMLGGSAKAQINLGNILGGVLNGSKGETTTSTDNQNSLLSSLTTIFSNAKVATKDKIIGTWVYEEPAIVFESDNLLSSAGGKLAASAIENKLQKQLEKYGFKKGTVKMTFDESGNFTQTMLGKTLSGTYTIKGKSVVLMYGGRIKQIAGTTQLDGNSLLIVMDASKLLNYVNILGKVSGSSTLKTASSLLSNMKGMECGLKLVKE